MTPLWPRPSVFPGKARRRGMHLVVCGAQWSSVTRSKGSTCRSSGRTCGWSRMEVSKAQKCVWLCFYVCVFGSMIFILYVNSPTINSKPFIVICLKKAAECASLLCSLRLLRRGPECHHSVCSLLPPWQQLWGLHIYHGEPLPVRTLGLLLSTHILHHDWNWLLCLTQKMTGKPV